MDNNNLIHNSNYHHNQPVYSFQQQQQQQQLKRSSSKNSTSQSSSSSSSSCTTIPNKRSSISDTPFIQSSPLSSSDSNTRSRTTSISLVRPPSSPTNIRTSFNEPELISHNISNITSPPTTTSSSTSTSSSSIYTPQNPRRRVSLSIQNRGNSYINSNPYSTIQIQSPPTPRRSRTMSYSRVTPISTSSMPRNERTNSINIKSKSSSSSSTKTRKIIITILILLSLFLVGTVIVLSSVSYYLGIPNWAYLTESEVSWRPTDIIKPLKDPLNFNGNGNFTKRQRKSKSNRNSNQRRKEWRDVTENILLEVGENDVGQNGEDGGSEPIEAIGVLGTDTLPESWKELEEEMEELDAEEDAEESPAYDDSVEVEHTEAASENELQLDVNAENNSGEWGIDGEGSGGYWMRKDWNGKVQDTKTWDRLFNVTNRPGETIPRLIHQTWKTDVLPEKWRKAWKECREGMPDYEYMLWTDDVSREFIATHYPAHLHMFDTYEYPIQRADSIRYFILHHFGGVYMDLDIGCRRRLDPLLQGDWEVILPITKPVGVSNDLIFSSKGSAFMDDTVHGLSTFNHQYLSNYPTVMFSTGPMFLSAQYALYSSAHPLTETHPRAEVRILPKSLYGKNAPISTVPHSFFSHFYGSSWHSDDAGFITFLGVWGKKLMWVGLVVVILAVIRLIWLKRKAANGQQYQLLSILPTTTSTSNNGGGGNRSGASTPTSTGSSGPMSPSTTFDLGNLPHQLPNDIASVFKRAGNLILAAPATLLYGNERERDRRTNRRGRTGLLYFVPALFQPDQTRRRGRTASEASQLPLRRSRRDRTAPPPYNEQSENERNDTYQMSSTKRNDKTMDEVDSFLLEADTEGESSTTYNDNDLDHETELESENDNQQSQRNWDNDNWRRKSDVGH